MAIIASPLPRWVAAGCVAGEVPIEAMEIHEYALSILIDADLARRLTPPPDDLTDERPAASLPTRPVRPPGLEIVTDPRRKKRVPSITGMPDPAQRVRILHALANHELQAVELFAWALLRFPSAEPPFRRGLLRILAEEQDHCRRYLARVEAMGARFGDFPLSGYFWSKVDELITPLHFVCAMCLTFENANLDHALDLAAAARACGDEATAQVLDLVHRDELGHVRFGWHWLAAWKQPQQTMSEAWLSHIPWPLRPALARGDTFHRQSRETVGLDAEFIAMLEQAERPRALYRFERGRTRAT